MSRLLKMLCGFMLLCMSMQAQVLQMVEDRDERAQEKDVQRQDYDLKILKDKYNQAVQAEDKKAQATSLQQMGNLCFHLGHFPQSLEYLLEALKVADKSKDRQLQGRISLDLSLVYYYNRDSLQARKCLDEAVASFAEAKDRAGMATVLGARGHFFEKQQQYDSALSFQRQALSIYQSIHHDKGIADIYENLGSVYEDLAVYDSAMFYFVAARNLYQRTGDSLSLVGTLNNIGDIFRKSGRLPQSAEYTRAAIAMAARQNEPYQLSSGYRDLAKTFNQAGQFDSAFFYSEVARGYLLQVYSLENNRQTSFYQAVYDIERKNDEIKMLRNNRNINLLICGVLVLVIILLVTTRYFINAKKRVLLNAEKLQADSEKNMLAAKSRMMEAELKARISEEQALKASLVNERLQQEKLEIELRNAALEEEQLKQQIELKTRELSTHTLHVIQKNQLLDELKANLEQLVKDDKRDHKKQLRQVIQQIGQNFNGETYWTEFRSTFEQVHHTFFEKLHQYCPNLSAAELRLVSLLKMNMNSQEIATMLGISADSLRVSRYRLRKKLNLEQGESLTVFLQSF